MNKVLEVRLKNFRCHEDFALDCPQSMTMIVGENGSGKTSILEAVYLALRGKSFKGVDREILRRGADFYRAEILLSDAQSVVIRFDGLKKSFEIDGKKSLRLPKKNRYPVVLFEPDDLHLVGSSPSRRRDYFDEFFKQIDANYGVALSKYTKALRQRNDLLKDEAVSGDELFSWNVLLAHYGAEILQRRLDGLEKINALLTDNYRGIAKNDDECRIEYLGEKDLSENRYMEILEKNFSRDVALGYTSFGVHRDDFEFVFNGEKADGSASRGEIRSIVLALKFIEAEVLEKELQKKPVVLLDDIFSELDDMRQQHLIENFKDYQMIVTSTNALRGIEGELLSL
jgi:DNA replication and repair protein RecF